ncbi:hypothetical protein N5E86_15930 [Stutzerimonas stutzeri]|uniref:hypothetical protein n=1 Tax=Stutzerimonas stutzeri TaxID=316 RepID=UPI00244A12BC|nr:hypothetical protein [Stutzerimonas stutzeri]MDH1555943.1 hypothetical protein [Stutzerimonas stutzeri]
MSTPLTKTLLQQALDMLEEQALHIGAPMLPAGEELLKRIRAAISQQVEPAQAQDEREAFIAAARNHKVEGSGFNLDATSSGAFRDNETRMLHEGWKLARANRPAQTAPQPEQRGYPTHCGCEQPDAFVVARHSKRLVEQLRAENTGLKAECEQLSETVMGQERVIGALEPDARRYQTLRQMHWNDGPLAVVVNPKANVKLGADCPSGERLDQMLDEIDEQRYPR